MTAAEEEQILAAGKDALSQIVPTDIRQMLLGGYEWGRFVYGMRVHRRMWPSPVHWARELGCILWYATTVDEVPHKGNTDMKIAEMVEKWHKVFVGLALAHDKDDADRYEASVEELLTPMLAAPVEQLRQFADLLLVSLMNDTQVPFLVWRAFEVYVEQMRTAPDGEIIALKTELAKEIVQMVEQDAKDQLPDAMIRALQWRSPEKLEQVKEVVAKEKAAGRKTRLKGRESCLFLEAGGTEEQPEVCVQV